MGALRRVNAAKVAHSFGRSLVYECLPAFHRINLFTNRRGGMQVVGMQRQSARVHVKRLVASKCSTDRGPRAKG